MPMLWNAKCSVVAQPAFGIKVQTLNQIVFASKKKEKRRPYAFNHAILRWLSTCYSGMFFCLHKMVLDMIIQWLLQVLAEPCFITKLNIYRLDSFVQNDIFIWKYTLKICLNWWEQKNLLAVMQLQAIEGFLSNWIRGNWRTYLGCMCWYTRDLSSLHMQWIESL